MAIQFVTKESLSRIDESTGQVSRDGTKTALLLLPYDIGFIAGYNDLYVAEKVAVKTYGAMVMCRTGTFVGIVGYLDSPPLGNTIIDIEKSGPGIAGTSIFSTKPQFTQTNNLTAGVLSTTTFASGNQIRFKVTTLGNVSQPGSGMRVILKCKV